MSGGFGFSREAVRVKVKKCEGNLQPEWRKFSVDPQITSFEVLQSILVKAFDLKGDFTICYRILDVIDREVYLPLLSDWDLDAAFLKAHNISYSTSTEPCLCLRIDLKSFGECPAEEWQAKQNLPVIPSNHEVKSAPRLHGIFNQMGKTFNMVQRAFNFGEDSNSSSGSVGFGLQPPRSPLTDAEFRKYLDPVGQILQPKELRSAIYFGGIEPSLRKVVWKHILNVYPDGMTGRERMDYIKRKSNEYIILREMWKKAITLDALNGELAYTTGMVRKDVLRTDRHHPFYAGSDDNQNIASLFNILTTYALNHPKVSYCQGMSDIASPLLVIMNDEAQAYICFCALMRRLCTNFMLDGIAMTQKFNHLAEGLMYYDSEFYNYLKLHQADDLLFCYRWLLLEMKREFAFEDSLRMLEVLWSSLPADPPHIELKLFDVQFEVVSTPPPPPPHSPIIKSIRENPYTKMCALRRQSSSISLHNYVGKKSAPVKRQIHSLDENFVEKDTSNNSCGLVNIKIKHQNDDNDEINTMSRTSSYSLDNSPKSSKQFTIRSELLSRSVSSPETKSDSRRLVTKSLSSSMSNLLIIKNSKNNIGHSRDLIEKCSSKTCKIVRYSSYEILNNKSSSANADVIKSPSPNNKMIKNLNEFLNFAVGNQNKMCNRSASVSDCDDKPKIALAQSSFDNCESRNDKTDSSVSHNDTFSKHSPDDLENYFPMMTTVTTNFKLEMVNLNRHVFGGNRISSEHVAVVNGGVNDENNINVLSKTKNDDIFVWENPLHQASSSKKISTNDEDIAATGVNENSKLKVTAVSWNPQKIDKETRIAMNNKVFPSSLTCNKTELNDTSILSNSCEEVTEIRGSLPNLLLPPPNEFGGGNPFLMFLCITVLLQHRNYIIANGMDYNEMAMHFDKMVRKHNVIKVLNQARQMYARYIRQHTMLAQQKLESCATENCC